MHNVNREGTIEISYLEKWLNKEPREGREQSNGVGFFFLSKERERREGWGVCCANLSTASA